MAIGNAVQKGSIIYIYDERGRQTGAISAGNVRNGDGLTGYTSGTVNVRKGSLIYTYNDKGRQLAATSAR